MLHGKDPEAMLRALGAGRARLVVACPPPSPRAQPAAALVAAALRLGARGGRGRLGGRRARRWRSTRPDPTT